MLDLLPLSETLPADLLLLSSLARELRGDKCAHMVLENSLIHRFTGSAEAFSDKITKDFIGAEWERYTSILEDTDALEALLRMAAPAEARLSPITLALLLGNERRQPYDPTPYARFTSNRIVDAVQGRCAPALVIEMPPRHGKTTLISRRTAEWVLINDPTRSVGICGYSDSFASEHGRTARNDILDSPGVFGFGVAADSSAAQAWHTSLGGSLWCAGTKGSATGRGCHLLIIDDPVKDAADAYSLTERDANWMWYSTTARTRLQQNGIMCCIQTRWHEDDLAGRILASAAGTGEMVEVKFPAICEEDEDLLGRKKGQALWPAKYPLAALEKTKRDVGPEAWCALFAQSPIGASQVGRVYSEFQPKIHVRNLDDFDSEKKVYIGWDFNVNPLCIVLAQAEEITHWRDTSRQYILKVFDELALPDTNSQHGADALGERLLRWAKGRKLTILVTGDASGSRRQTSATNLGGDHQIIRDYFNRRSGSNGPFQVAFDFAKSNLSVRESVSQVNTLLRTADGLSHFQIDPRCRETIIDLGANRWRRDSNGNFLDTIDDSDPRRGHCGDALRYLIRSLRRNSQGFGEMAAALPGVSY